MAAMTQKIDDEASAPHDGSSRRQALKCMAWAGTGFAFPQPAPGTAPSAGPMKVPPGSLDTWLGTTDVTFVRGQERLAIVDRTLA
jgi:hypothetical protein